MKRALSFDDAEVDDGELSDDNAGPLAPADCPSSLLPTPAAAGVLASLFSTPARQRGVAAEGAEATRRSRSRPPRGAGAGGAEARGQAATTAAAPSTSRPPHSRMSAAAALRARIESAVERLPAGEPPQAAGRGSYMCRKCGLPKRGHGAHRPPPPPALCAVPHRRSCLLNARPLPSRRRPPHMRLQSAHSRTTPTRREGPHCAGETGNLRGGLVSRHKHSRPPSLINPAPPPSASAVRNRRLGTPLTRPRPKATSTCS